jgi:hypothetical protein
VDAFNVTNSSAGATRAPVQHGERQHVRPDHRQTAGSQRSIRFGGRFVFLTDTALSAVAVGCRRRLSLSAVGCRPVAVGCGCRLSAVGYR